MKERLKRTSAGAGLVAILALLLPAVRARADSIDSPVTLNDGLSSPADLQQTDFGAGDSVYALFEPGPGQQWTTPQNSGLTSDLLSLILSLGGDPALIAQLFQPGAIFAPSDATAQGEILPFSPVVSSLQITQQIVPVIPGEVPEPATMRLLGAALLLLSFFAVWRVSKRKPV